MPEDDLTAPRFRVLIVDDQEPVRTFVQRVLQQRYEAVIAADAFEAMRLAETNGPFDLLVSDVKMPMMAGDELASNLRRTDPTLKVLYLTGYSGQLFATRNALSPGEAFLDKPTTVQGLLEAVALMLSGRIPPPRAARLRVPGAWVRLANDAGPIVLLNVNGLLAHIGTQVDVGSIWPLILDLPSACVHVRGRVVSTEPASSLSSDAPDGVEAVALAFIDASAETRSTLERICREHGLPQPAPKMIG